MLAIVVGAGVKRADDLFVRNVLGCDGRAVGCQSEQVAHELTAAVANVRKNRFDVLSGASLSNERVIGRGGDVVEGVDERTVEVEYHEADAGE